MKEKKKSCNLIHYRPGLNPYPLNPPKHSDAKWDEIVPRDINTYISSFFVHPRKQHYTKIPADLSRRAGGVTLAEFAFRTTIFMCDKYVYSLVSIYAPIDART